MLTQACLSKKMELYHKGTVLLQNSRPCTGTGAPDHKESILKHSLQEGFFLLCLKEKGKVERGRDSSADNSGGRKI